MKAIKSKGLNMLIASSFLIALVSLPILTNAEENPDKQPESNSTTITSIGSYINGDKNIASGVSNVLNVSGKKQDSSTELSTKNTVSITGIGAVVSNGNQNTAIGINTQAIAGADSNINITGIGAAAGDGDGNTAIGVNSQIIDGGTNNNAVGYGAQAGAGNNNTAIGKETTATFGDGNVAIGTKTTAGGLSSSSSYNTAIGYGAVASTGGSVAIGAFSVADRPNSVSVGQPGYERQITNVAPGVYDTDAVNVSQLRGVDRRIDSVGACAFAMSALAPLAYNPNEPTQYSAGIGTYNGKVGFAIGIFHYTKENVLLNAAIAFSNDGWEKAARAGITWRVGKKPKPVELPKPLIINNTPEPKQEIKPKEEPKPETPPTPAEDTSTKVRKG